MLEHDRAHRVLAGAARRLEPDRRDLVLHPVVDDVDDRGGHSAQDDRARRADVGPMPAAANL
ncbi:hypothetical protein AB2L57_13900 [Microbacterium sp. HA-8]|uniref:hypothetical protein n=1 Tax=Microbacterium sp. HA-8 TaxID=3234200 RepID=UPI0038F5DA29